MILKDVCYYNKERINTKDIDIKNYISTENMVADKGGVILSNNMPQSVTVTKYECGDVLLSNIRPYFKKIWLAEQAGGCSNDILCIRSNGKINREFLYYLLSQQTFFDYVMTGCKGCKMPRGDKNHILEWPIDIPALLTEQKSIAHILKSLDDKIKLNRKINDNLSLYYLKKSA